LSYDRRERSWKAETASGRLRTNELFQRPAVVGLELSYTDEKPENQ